MISKPRLPGPCLKAQRFPCTHT